MKRALSMILSTALLFCFGGSAIAADKLPDKPEVDKTKTEVTVTIPKDFIGEVTEEKVQETLKKNGYRSAVLNEDGSVTYVMTLAQHEELLDFTAKSIEESIEEMIKKGDTNLVKAEHNDDFTGFTVTISKDDLSMSDMFTALSFYTFGGMYNAFAGEKVDNIHVIYQNEKGDFIKDANSNKMGSK